MFTRQGDYGQFRVMAHVLPGQAGSSFDTAGPSNYAPYNPKDSIWSPFHFKASLQSYGTTTGPTTIEVVPTTHGSIIKASFPPLQGQETGGLDEGWGVQTRRLLVALERPETDALEIHGVDDDDGNGLLSFSGVEGSFAYFSVHDADDDDYALF